MIADVAERFLEDVEARDLPWTAPADAPAALITDRVLLGNGDAPVEVAIAYSESGAPKTDELRRLWKLRHNNRPSPVLLVVLYSTAGAVKAATCGILDDPIVDLDTDQVGRICISALAEPNQHVAQRTLARLLTALRKEESAPGLLNKGLFATHELRNGVPLRPDWAAAGAAARPLLRLRGLALIQALGYGTASRGSVAMLLTHQGTSRSIAVLLEDGEAFDRPSSRFGAVSPVSHAISVAARENLPWVIVLRGSQIRLHPVQPTIGVGRKSQGETFTELDLALLSDDNAAYLHLLFSPQALAPEGTVSRILIDSTRFAAELGGRLRERVYRDVVPNLAVAVARQMRATTEANLQEAYHRTLIILFRLLFVAYAEDRALLPYGRNPRYDRHAIKTLAKDFADDPGQAFDDFATSLWDGMQAVWNAIDGGNAGWDIPPYNGGLFSHDPQTSPSGAALAGMRLTDAEFGPALHALLVDTGPDGTQGPVDFRSLSVREFGTLYEGLLESSLSIAPTPLTVDKDGNFVPAKDSDLIEVPAGAIYFHNRSGKRKSTGSYFTKSFAVEHLLTTALEPALDEHLDRVRALLEAGDEAAAAELFFDFRVADLAMGSAHFLVAAIDRIEARFTAFLGEHPIAAVGDELIRLSQAAQEALGPRATEVEIETSSLLRRQIARRCIYGLDLNLMAVELARLAIWIHTFVPGLPMSSLDHGLIVGNSLTGIGTLSEALEVLEPKSSIGQMSLYADKIEEALQVASERLKRVARTDEAKKAEVQDAADAYRLALVDAADAKHILDAAVAVRLGLLPLPVDADDAITSVAGDDDRAKTIRQELERFGVTHLPYRFPEVFVRSTPGFDVILGNPPWDKVRWEAAPFWAGIFPGVVALKDEARKAKITELRKMHPMEAIREQEEMAHREVLQQLFKASYALRGDTHLEFAQLMLERALKLKRISGYLGLVLPRQSMVLAGWKRLRRELTAKYDLRIIQGRNHSEWIFEDVESRIAVVFLSASPTQAPVTRIWIANSPSDVTAATDENAIVLTQGEVASFSDSHVIPWFATPNDRQLFETMRHKPRLASGEGWIMASHDARWDFTGSGPDRSLAVREKEAHSWKILMTAHVDQFHFDISVKFKQFVRDLDALCLKNRGIGRKKGETVLTERHPMIIFRRPSTVDNSRTMIATALPEAGLLHNKGYISAAMHDAESNSTQRLALLGLLNTLCVDWWARRFVDRHVTAPVINQIPLPDWSQEQIAEAAEITSCLLARHGYTRLAGGITVGNTKTDPEIKLRARLEHLALDGYGLDQQDLELIAADFNETGLPMDLRRELDVAHVPAKTKR
ncbi:hypothetical protein OUY22_21185 [Nonomuraea sp. MCN248]|uniref:site-specific DNA-methyltransferase (adenine-specific) n=1 Tax=Nonomuraea corallina TaxID=2989783 RepID=A0ABT4SFK6_9ACTN|nr:hypothetical protein [Nonomuraea corallina]MDA0635944.1 hypothetical protein [Nonomuraea corallina]